jgi:hypothetical protein
MKKEHMSGRGFEISRGQLFERADWRDHGWPVVTPDEMSTTRSRPVEAVAAHDHADGVGGADLVVAFGAIDAARELMRQLEASGVLMRGGDPDFAEGE